MQIVFFQLPIVPRNGWFLPHQLALGTMDRLIVKGFPSDISSSRFQNKIQLNQINFREYRSLVLADFEKVWKPGVNLCTLTQIYFFPLSGCDSCEMVLSRALAACNQNPHSLLPANFCRWQPRLSLIFPLLKPEGRAQKAIWSCRKNYCVHYDNLLPR